MILRRYGTNMQSVETNFDSKAFTEIGFRRDHAYSSLADEFLDGHERISEHLLEAESEGDVQDEVESAMLQRLLDQLLKIDGDLADTPVRVYSGGPVDSGQGFILHGDGHRDENNPDDSLIEAGGLTLSTSIELMRSIAAGEGPRRSLLLFGYAGWGPGQLEGELMRDDWVAVTADEDLVFGSDDETKWRRSLDRLEIDL